MAPESPAHQAHSPGVPRRKLGGAAFRGAKAEAVLTASTVADFWCPCTGSSGDNLTVGLTCALGRRD